MNEIEQLYKDTLHEEDVAAIIIEPVLGEGGYCPAPPEFLKQVRDFAHSKDALMICDEVQTGKSLKVLIVFSLRSNTHNIFRSRLWSDWVIICMRF